MIEADPSLSDCAVAVIDALGRAVADASLITSADALSDALELIADWPSVTNPPFAVTDADTDDVSSSVSLPNA